MRNKIQQCQEPKVQSQKGASSCEPVDFMTQRDDSDAFCCK